MAVPRDDLGIAVVELRQVPVVEAGFQIRWRYMGTFVFRKCMQWRPDRLVPSPAPLLFAFLDGFVSVWTGTGPLCQRRFRSRTHPSLACFDDGDYRVVSFGWL